MATSGRNGLTCPPVDTQSASLSSWPSVIMSSLMTIVFIPVLSLVRRAVRKNQMEQLLMVVRPDNDRAHRSGKADMQRLAVNRLQRIEHVFRIEGNFDFFSADAFRRYLLRYFAQLRQTG